MPGGAVQSAAPTFCFLDFFFEKSRQVPMRFSRVASQFLWCSRIALSLTRVSASSSSTLCSSSCAAGTLLRQNQVETG